MDFPYGRYKTLVQQFTLYYPPEEEELARWIIPTLEKAIEALEGLLLQYPQNGPEQAALNSQLPGTLQPHGVYTEKPKMSSGFVTGKFETSMVVLIVPPADWPLAPHDDAEQLQSPHPYWTAVTSPPTLVVPTQIDTIFGSMTATKFAFILYHELALAFAELDPRPWPEDYPLWADEWPLKFAALWLSHTLDHQNGLVNQDIAERFEDLFEPEEDGKTPVTIRGFDWYEDTNQEDYLQFQILLEQFAADLLACYPATILPRFLELYRTKKDRLLSDDVTSMLSQVLGPGGDLWLEDLVYF